MNIAIVGRGLAGLAVGWHLLKLGCQVTFLDEKKLGCSASGVAAGLMHPYAGDKARRSVEADEGIAHAEELFGVSEQALGRPVIVQRGLIRLALHDEQRKNLKEASDAEEIEKDQFLIHSGMTIDVPSYLEGLFLACAKLGVNFIQTKVSLDGPLPGYDHTVFACGYRFLESRYAKRYSIKPMKGQVLVAKSKAPLEKSQIAKGYVARGFDPHTLILGATYERRFEDEKPCLAKAKEDLLPKVEPLLSSPYEIVEARAGVRLIREGFYFPFAERLDDRCFWLGALGFRGLLYHAYLGKKLACAIVQS